MSLINFPNVPLQEFRIDVVVPNVIRHSSIYTAKELIHSRGNMHYAGRIGWARRHLDRIDEISAIEAFLAHCYGPVNEFNVPVPRDQTKRFTDPADLTISAVTTTGTFHSEFTATAGLQAGDWCNFGTRLHKIVAVNGTSYTVVPGILDDETTMQWHTPTLRARVTDEVAGMPRVGGSAGPWSLDVKEIL